MIYCLIGTSASGKSTLARNMVRHMNAVIVSRDNLREMMFGYRPEEMASYYQREDFGNLEKVISDYQDALIKKALKRGQDVILDNTHLKLTYINKLKDYNVPIKFVPVEVDYKTAYERDLLRDRIVGDDVLRRQFEDLENLKRNFDFKDWVPAPTESFIPDYDYNKRNAFIVDIDGTIALNTSGRSPYDWKRVGEDEPNRPVIDVVNALYANGYTIILCSGRDAVCRPETELWLSEQSIPHKELHMRKEGDNRKDSIVKEEMWRELVKRYNIIAMIDDREQVIDHARKLGFVVLDVAGNTF